MNKATRSLVSLIAMAALPPGGVRADTPQRMNRLAGAKGLPGHDAAACAANLDCDGLSTTEWVPMCALLAVGPGIRS